MIYDGLALELFALVPKSSVPEALDIRRSPTRGNYVDNYSFVPLSEANSRLLASDMNSTTLETRYQAPPLTVLGLYGRRFDNSEDLRITYSCNSAPSYSFLWPANERTFFANADCSHSLLAGDIHVVVESSKRSYTFKFFRNNGDVDVRIQDPLNRLPSSQNSMRASVASSTTGAALPSISLYTDYAQPTGEVVDMAARGQLDVFSNQASVPFPGGTEGQGATVTQNSGWNYVAPSFATSASPDAPLQESSNIGDLYNFDFQTAFENTPFESTQQQVSSGHETRMNLDSTIANHVAVAANADPQLRKQIEPMVIPMGPPSQPASRSRATSVAHSRVAESLSEMHSEAAVALARMKSNPPKVRENVYEASDKSTPAASTELTVRADDKQQQLTTLFTAREASVGKCSVGVQEQASNPDPTSSNPVIIQARNGIRDLLSPDNPRPCKGPGSAAGSTVSLLPESRAAECFKFLVEEVEKLRNKDAMELEMLDNIREKHSGTFEAAKKRYTRQLSLNIAKTNCTKQKLDLKNDTIKMLRLSYNEAAGFKTSFFAQKVSGVKRKPLIKKERCAREGSADFSVVGTSLLGKKENIRSWAQGLNGHEMANNNAEISLISGQGPSKEFVAATRTASVATAHSKKRRSQSSIASKRSVRGVSRPLSLGRNRSRASSILSGVTAVSRNTNRHLEKMKAETATGAGPITIADEDGDDESDEESSTASETTSSACLTITDVTDSNSRNGGVQV